MLWLLNLLLIGMVLATAVAVVTLRDLLVAAILLSGNGLLLALLWTRLGSPDLALFHVALMVCMATLMLVITINRTSRKEDE